MDIDIMNKICNNCNKEYTKPDWCSKVNWVKRKYCTRECSEVNTAFKLGDRINLGRKHPPEYGERISELKKGIPSGKYSRVDFECLQCSKVFKIQQNRIGKAKYCSRACHYKARDFGLTTKHYRIRRSSRYKQWREAIFERDDYTCQMCFTRGGILNADHVKPFALFPDLRFDLDNGRTLCLPCHKLTPTYGAKTRLVSVTDGY